MAKEKAETIETAYSIQRILYEVYQPTAMGLGKDLGPTILLFFELLYVVICGDLIDIVRAAVGRGMPVGYEKHRLHSGSDEFLIGSVLVWRFVGMYIRDSISEYS